MTARRRTAADYAACAERGLTMAETARELGVTVSTVCDAARHHGITFRRSQKAANRYRACAAEGLSPLETAQRLGVSRAAVYDYARRHGITFRREEPAVARYRACAERGLTMAETARELGVSRAAVREMAKKHGLSFRCGRWAPPPALLQHLRDLAAQGLTLPRAAKIAGITYDQARGYARRNRIAFVDGRTAPVARDRPAAPNDGRICRAGKRGDEKEVQVKMPDMDADGREVGSIATARLDHDAIARDERAAILAAARQAVTVDRAATHGEAEASFAQIAAIWSARLGVDIRPDQVALMMIDLKTARAWNNPAHRDNWVDIAGYAACGGEIAGRRE